MSESVGEQIAWVIMSVLAGLGVFKILALAGWLKVMGVGVVLGE